MTAALEALPQALEEWDVSLDCEVASHSGDPRPATRSVQGCGDKRHYLTCTPCFKAFVRKLRGWHGEACNHCHRPILAEQVETHFNEVAI